MSLASYPEYQIHSTLAVMPLSVAGTATPETEPLPVISRRIGWRDSLHSFRSREYRWYAAGLLCSSIGVWIARIATDWLVLEITGDVALLGIVIAAQLLPPMLLGAWGGVVSDWIPPRTSVITSQMLFAALFAWMGVLEIIGGVGQSWVLAISVLIGLVSCVDGPSRAVLTHQVVGTGGLPNAISLNAVLPQIAGVLGAALAGVSIATLDIGRTMLVASIGLLVGATATLCIRASRLESRQPVRPQRGQIRLALRYAWRKPAITLSMVMVGVLSVSALSASVLYAWAAESKFDTGAAGYSLFSSVGAAGALVGGLLATRRRAFSISDNAVMLGLSGGVWIAAGFAPWLAVFVCGLLATGVARMLFLVANDTLAQLSANTAIRGRIVALYLMTVTGGQVVGSVLLGWLVATYGGEAAFLVTGLAPMVSAVAIIVIVKRGSRRSPSAPVVP